MTGEECREVYRRLLEMLGDPELASVSISSLNGVAEEVNSVIRAGQVIEQIDGSIKRSSKRDFITTREYTPQEELQLLIDAIESVVVQTAFIEKEVTNFFQKEGENFNIAPEIILISEDDSQEKILRYRSASDRAEQARVLQRLLEQLRLEVEE